MKYHDDNDDGALPLPPLIRTNIPRKPTPQEEETNKKRNHHREIHNKKAQVTNNTDKLKKDQANNSTLRLRTLNPNFSRSKSSDDTSLSDKPGVTYIPGVTRVAHHLSTRETTIGNHIPTAIMVATKNNDKETALDEAEKRQIEEQVKNKYFANVIKAEEDLRNTPASIEEEERRKKSKFWILTTLGVVITFVMAMVVAILLLSPDPDPKPEPPKPTLPPKVLNGTNIVCDSAYDISSMITTPILGNITELARVAPVDTCEVIFRNGVGVWYKLQGDGSRYRASTCDGTAFDTQISIFFGACGKLQCVAGNDQMASCGNGDQSIVAFATELNINYYIYVHARRNAQSLFTLLVETLESNDQCENAVLLTYSINSERISIEFGSTRGAHIDEVDCFGIIPNAPGVWYTVEGMGYDFGFGEYISVVLDTSDTDFSARVLVFEGDDCGSLRCVSSSGRGWEYHEDKKYYMLIHGAVPSTEGDFQFHIEESSSDTLSPGTITPFPTFSNGTILPPECFAEVMFPGEVLKGYTYDRDIARFGSCGDLVFSTSPGVWYDVIGTGGPMTVSTCESTSTFDTQISLFQGPCYQLECIDGNDQACGDHSRVSWFSQLDVVYHIVVHGYGIDQEGQFTITVEEVDDIVGSDNCDAAIDILSSSYGISVLGDMDGPSAEHTVYACGTEPENSPGVWYRIEGTGKGMVASTCLSSSLDGTTTRITVFDGNCDDLGCVEVVEYSCGSQHHAVGWTSELGKEYHIFVQAKDESSGAGSRFVLYVEEATSNVVCENVIGPLGADGLPTFGSTRSAVLSPPISDGTYVNDSVDMMGRGVWYTVLGTGTEVVASTCSKFTDFGTVLFVYEGLSCSSLTKVELLWSGSVDCFFEFGWNVSWNSVEGELYYLLVVGSDSDSFGNFVVLIAEV